MTAHVRMCAPCSWSSAIAGEPAARTGDPGTEPFILAAARIGVKMAWLRSPEHLYSHPLASGCARNPPWRSPVPRSRRRQPLTGRTTSIHPVLRQSLCRPIGGPGLQGQDALLRLRFDEQALSRADLIQLESHLKWLESRLLASASTLQSPARRPSRREACHPQLPWALRKILGTRLS
jgi:hypothetical protein